MKLQVFCQGQNMATILFSGTKKDLVLNYKWRVNALGYVYSSFKDSDGKWQKITLHRLIMGLSKGDKQHCDHINGNKLDNRDCNLRLCTHAQNMLNRKPQKNGKSKYKGVSPHKSGKYQAVICVNGRNKYLGLFKKESSAAEAYNIAAKELHGEFAYLNTV